MKRYVLLAGVAAAMAYSAELTGVHSVYVLPMSRGMDQYLANRLTQEHVFTVVTDPKKADAIFTDQIGERFEQTLTEILPSPEPVAPPPSNKDKNKDKDAEATLPSETVNQIANPPSAFVRSKGNVFLVDPKSRSVLWSVYQPAKESGSSGLDRTATDIVNRLKRDLKPK